MLKIISPLFVFLILLVCCVNFSNANPNAPKTSRPAEPLKSLVKHLRKQETSFSPVYIKLEIEDFAEVSMQESASWQQNMAWYPHWSRGGASGWWSVKGLPAASTGKITQDIYVPQAGEYLLWIRYQDYTGKAEPFSISIDQNENTAKAEFGKQDIITQPDLQIPWNYVWDKKILNLRKGKAAVSVLLEQNAEAPRAVDALILTNDLKWIPKERGFPPQAYSNYLLKWSEKRIPLKPLINLSGDSHPIRQSWTLPQIAGRDFWYLGGTGLISGYPFPVNIRPEIKNPNSAAAFAARYSSNPKSAPIFGSAINGLQIPISKTGELLQSDNPLRNYILSSKSPFVLVGNYNSAGKIPNSYQQLQQIFGGLWLGIVSGENSYLRIPFYSDNIPAEAEFKTINYQWLLNDGKSKWQQMLSADWASPIINPFEKIIPGLSVGNLPHIHQLAESGVKILGGETAGASPYVQLQMAFVRGAGRQYKIPWMWYFGASFGDSIRTFTDEGAYNLELEGLKIDNRNAIIGPSLAHIRRSLLFSYLQGASLFYPEQGYNLFDTNGELNPMGWSYDELIRLATKHPNRGVLNTPVAVLLDKSHGWDKYTYNGMKLWNTKSLDRSDQMINQFFNVAYYPFPKNEGDFVNDLNVPFPNGYFGDIFDVLVTSPSKMENLQDYPVLFCVGDTKLDAAWAERLKKYVNDGGTLVINAEQVVEGLDEAFLGVNISNTQKESNTIICERDKENLSGTTFPYREAAATSAAVIARTASGDPVAFLNKVGKGQVILTTPSYLMGYDEVALPYVAHLLLELTANLQPVDVQGNCQYFVNLRPDGYVLTLSNNEGLIKMSHSPAKIDMSKTSKIKLSIKDKPLATEDWIADNAPLQTFPNEWLREYTQPKKLLWQQSGKQYETIVDLLPGEIRVYFIKTANR